MKKKERRKRVVNYKRIFIIIGIVFIVSGLIYGYFNMSLNNIYVSGNKVLSEQEIIELANVENYPKFYKISCRKIKKRLLMSPFVSGVEVKKTITGKLFLDVKEFTVLFSDEINDTLVLSNGTSFYSERKISGIPVLTNMVDKEIYPSFLNKMSLINEDIKTKISEITYDPNDLDKERFLLYMNDKNYVYLTISKFESINNYNKILLTLEGKKGTLYLDSGNHFQIRK